VNKKDCDEIAYILCEGRLSDDVCALFFALDERIQGNYDDWKYAQGRADGVNDRFEELMVQKHGYSWCLMKSANAEAKSILEQARRDVYGEDYHPSLFR
jgi:hypothetical protein